MPVLNNAAEVATEIERVRSKLADLFQLDDTLFNMVKAKTSVDVVSTRPERPVFKTGLGVKSRVVDLNGGDLGRGGGPQWAFGALAQVYFDWGIEWTKLAEAATRTRAQSAIDVAKDIVKDHMRVANFNMDSLIAYGDGANTLGIVTTSPTAGVAYDAANFIVYVDNAARFYPGQDVDYYNGGLGTAITGTFTVRSQVTGANAVYATAAITTAPVNGAYILQNNSTGIAGSGLNGVITLNSGATTGTYMGVSRSQNPGLFTTPNINAGGATLTPAIARLLMTQLKYATGIDTTTNSSYIYLMGPAQRVAWENAGTIITQVTQTSANAMGHDQLPMKQVETIGGIPIRETIKGIPGRIDLINLNTWYRTEVLPMDFYSAGSVETFWPTGASGGPAASFMKYLVWGGNIGCDNPLANAFITNLATPAGYTI